MSTFPPLAPSSPKFASILASAVLPAVLSLGTLALSTPSTAAAGEAITVAVENDVFTGSDDSYSNGLGVTWVSDELGAYEGNSPLRRWGAAWDFLPFVGDDGYTTYAAWSLTQEIHTPDDITITDPPADDQPYAGVLYLDSVLYARSERWTHAWELKLGLVGESSGAGSVQREFHELIGADRPMGWDSQLPDEPIINLGLTSAYLWKGGPAGKFAEWRLVPVGNVGIGTYYTGAGLGIYGEIGWNLADALGGTSLRNGFSAASTVGVDPTEEWSVSLFSGVGGHAVAHYLPLDGTVSRSSRSVDSEPLVGSVTVGASARRGNLVLSLAATHSTRGFEGQEKGAEFGTLSVSWYPAGMPGRL